MPDLFENRRTSIGKDGITDNMAAHRIVEDFSSGVFGKEKLANGCKRNGGTNDFSVFVAHDGSIGISIEGDSDVRTGLADFCEKVFHVFAFDGGRVVVGKIPIRLKIQRDERKPKPVGQCLHKNSGGSVSGIRDNFQVAQIGLGVAGQKIDPFRKDVFVSANSFSRRLDKSARIDQMNKLRTDEFEIDGSCVFETCFKSVVFLRIVTCGDHDTKSRIRKTDG